jgi:hypothetical protein
VAGWLAARSHPAGISPLALLTLVSVALGGQSIWALRIPQTTTYFTGMLTKTVNAAVSVNPATGTSLRQLGALLAGPSWPAWCCTPCARPHPPSHCSCSPQPPP